MTAGAGFGKTTALAQAVRANLSEPRGIDAWLSCEPRDEDPNRLANVIVKALDVDAPSGPHLDRISYAINRLAPIDVCLVVDDLHELPTGSPGEQLVAELVRTMPTHLHVVLASRTEVALPLARVRVAGGVIEIDNADLAFTSDEISELARLRGTSIDGADQFAGWPSLVQLAMSARPGAATEFLWEEIVAGLDPSEQMGLLALATLGWGSADDVAMVAGDRINPGRLIGVPLVSDIGDGRLGVHRLWEEAIDRIFAADVLRDVRRRALETIHRRGEALRLGDAALRWGDDEWLRQAALMLLEHSWGALPMETAERWLQNASVRCLRTPEFRLLRLAIEHGHHPDDPMLDREVDVLLDEFTRRGDDNAVGKTLGLGAIIAHVRGDGARLFQFAQLARELPSTATSPLLRFFVGAMDAALASIGGDAGASIRLIEQLDFDAAPPAVSELVTRLRVMMLVVSGRADEATKLADGLAQSHDEHVRSIPAYLRWQAGDPRDYLVRSNVGRPSTITNDHDRFVHDTERATIAAGLGDRDIVRSACAIVHARSLTDLNPSASAFAATALACEYILNGDDAAAAAAICAHLDRHRDASAVAEMHLRRHLAIGYVCSEELRARWGADGTLGPVHRRSVQAADALLRARGGRLERVDALPSREVAVTSLPFPWTIELGVRAHAVGHPGAAAFVSGVADWLLVRTRTELTNVIDHGESSLAASAGELLETLPCSPRARLYVELLGPLRLSLDDHEVTAPELRRGRVRTLLQLLAVRGALRRDQIIEAMWPDVHVDVGRQNLRVTLSRLRRAVEPERDQQRSGARLIVDGDLIQLADSPLVEVDLWRFRRHLTAARRADGTANSPLVTSRLEDAFALWRTDPLEALSSVTGLEGDVEHIRRDLVDVGLRLGELHHVAGRFDDALACADRSLMLSPYSERAHRLAIAAHVQRGDHHSLKASVSALTAMLDELDVDPEPSTRMLLRRCGLFRSLLLTSADGDRDMASPLPEVVLAHSG